MSDNLNENTNDYRPCIFCETALYVGDDLSIRQQPQRGIHAHSDDDVKAGVICPECCARLEDLGKRRISALTIARDKAREDEDVRGRYENHELLVGQADLQRLLGLQYDITPKEANDSLASGPRFSELWGTLRGYRNKRLNILHFLSIESLRQLLGEYKALVSAPMEKAYAEALERGWLSVDPDSKWRPEPEGHMKEDSRPGPRCPGCGNPSDGGSLEFAGPPTCRVCYELFGNLDDVDIFSAEPMSWPAYAPNASIQQIHDGLYHLATRLRTLSEEALSNGWLAGPPGDLDSLEKRTRSFEQMVESGDYLNGILQ